MPNLFPGSPTNSHRCHTVIRPSKDRFVVFCLSLTRQINSLIPCPIPQGIRTVRDSRTDHICNRRHPQAAFGVRVRRRFKQATRALTLAMCVQNHRRNGDILGGNPRQIGNGYMPVIAASLRLPAQKCSDFGQLRTRYCALGKAV